MCKISFLTFLLAIFCHIALAQMPNDGLMMPKRQWCTLVQYTQSSWTEYWEGPLQRSNSNLGTFSARHVMLMSNYGITDRLNAMVALPFVWTKSSASYLDGQEGLQDLSVWLKYEALKKSVTGGEFKIQITGGASTPLTNYPADFLPFSIGFQSRTASLRGVLNFTHRMGFYATAQAGHTWRAPVSIDRDAYLFNDRLYYTNRVPVPNMLDATGRFGFINTRVQAEVTLDYFTGLSGDDIRYNEAPFLTNRMKATTAGIFTKYFFKPFAVQVAAGRVFNGRNVGQSTLLSAGVTYQFGVSQVRQTN